MGNWSEADLLRVYYDPAQIAKDGYPHLWRKKAPTLLGEPPTPPPIKNDIRELAGHRCQRCNHPYPPGITESCPRGEWTPCDERCSHSDEIRTWTHPPGMESMPGSPFWPVPGVTAGQLVETHDRVDARWRILTTHHLNGVKHDCRWWNLAALCQRCHLVIQGKVYMERTWDRPHTAWFKMHAAGFYASHILGEELTREETAARLDELLALELRQPALDLDIYDLL